MPSPTGTTGHEGEKALVGQPLAEKKYFKVDDIPDDIDYMSLNSINS